MGSIRQPAENVVDGIAGGEPWTRPPATALSPPRTAAGVLHNIIH